MDKKVSEMLEEKLKIKNRGINLVRVNYANKETGEAIKKFVIENSLKQYHDGYVSLALYVGNYCLPYVIEKDALKIKEEFKGKVKLDLKRHVLGQNEVKDFKIGDKVIITTQNFIGGYSTSKGTICNIDDKKVTIRKYRSKTKGWYLRYGEEGSIIKGWDKR